jgi:hypothetical protein
MLTVYHVLLAVLFHTVKQECSKDAQRITRSVGECEAQKSIIERDLPKGKQDNALPNTDGRNRDIIIQIHNLEIKYTSSISKSRCFVAQMQETDLRSRRLLNRVGKSRTCTWSKAENRFTPITYNETVINCGEVVRSQKRGRE